MVSLTFLRLERLASFNGQLRAWRKLLASFTLQRLLTVSSFDRSDPRLALTYGEFNPSAPPDG